MFLVEPPKRVAVARRPGDLVEDLADVGRDVARAAAEGVGVDVDLAVQVAPVDLVRAGRRRDVGDLRQPHDARRAVGRRRPTVSGRRCRSAIESRLVRRQAHVDVVVLAVGRAPVADRWPATSVRSAPASMLTLRPTSRRGVALDLDRDRRLVGLERRVEVDQAGDRREPRGDRLRQPLELGQVGALDRELQALAAAQVGLADVGDGDAGDRAPGARAAAPSSASTLRLRSLRSTRRT